MGFLVAAIGAIASSVGGLVAGASAFMTTTFGAFGTFMLKTAVGFGMNLLGKAIAGKPDTPQFTIQGKIRGGGDVPRSYIVGWYSTAGSVVYHNTWGTIDKTPNAYWVQVVALSDLPVAGLTSVFVNGEKCTLTTPVDTDKGSPVLEYRKSGTDYLWVKFYDGTQVVADPYLVAKFSGHATRPYPSTRVGVGVAYAIVTARVNGTLFTGFPALKFELNGTKLYDPSKDTTVGGSGTQRWATPSTWGGDGDHLPAVQIYNMIRGVTWGGKWLYGLQSTTAARAPVAHWIEQIAKCRATITGPDGAEATYRCGGEIIVGAPIADAIEAILSTCQGRMTETGGTYKIFLGAPGAKIASFDDGHIISTQEQSFSPFFGLADTINGVTAKYPNPAEGWNPKAAPPLYRSDLEVLAGNRRLLADVSINFCPYGGQVQRLMKSALEEAQRARRHTFVLPPELWLAEPGDTIEWTSSARNGYVTKLFRVDGVIDKANLDVMVDITEIDPADYDWNQGTDYRVPVDGPLVIVRPPPQPVQDWLAVPSSILDPTGTGRKPAILLTWNASQDDVRAIGFEIRLASSGAIHYTGRTDSFTAGAILIAQNLLPNEIYHVRGIYIPYSQRDTVWSSWLSVTMLDIRLGPKDIYPITEEYLADQLRDLQRWIQEDSRLLIESVERLALSTLNQDLSNYTDKQQLRTELSSRAAGIEASYKLDIVAATGPGSALVQRVETLEAKVVGVASALALEVLTTRVTVNESGISTLSSSVTSLSAVVAGKASASALSALEARVTTAEGTLSTTVSDLTSLTATVAGKASTSALNLLDARVVVTEAGVTANSSSITTLTTILNGVTANTTFKMGTGYTPGSGWTARIGMEARVDTGSSFQAAGLYFDVTTIASRIVLAANQVVIMDNLGNVSALFDGGTAYIDTLRVRNLDYQNLTVGGVATTSVALAAFLDDAENAFGSYPTHGRMPSSGSGVWTTIASITVNNPSGKAVFLEYAISCHECRIRLYRSDGLEMANIFHSSPTASPVRTGILFQQDQTAPTGTFTYSMQVSQSTFPASGGAAYIKAMWWLR